MSKSLGNFFTIREVTAKYDPEVLRYFILSSHYRSPLNYSDVHLENAKGALTTLYTALRGIEVSDETVSQDNPYVQRFHAAMQDDFNTAEALAVLFELAREINKQRDSDPDKAQNAASVLHSLAGLLGLLQRSPEDYLRGGVTGGIQDAEIEALIQQRTAARQNKDWAESDRIRDELKAQGIILEDGAGGTTWRRE